MFVVHGTKKFLDRVPGPRGDGRESATSLGPWYATVLFWKPQTALFVSEPTLLPVLLPFAPSASLLSRFPPALKNVLQAHQVDPSFIEREIGAMGEAVLAKTNNRSVVGMMNEFAYLGAVHGDRDALSLSLRLARTPCGPLYRRNVSPDRELADLVQNELAEPPKP